MRRRLFGSTLALLAGCAAPPVGLVALLGRRMVMPPLWVHFYGVGVTALAATATAVGLTTVGVRRRDARTVVIGGGFSLMAALLAVHGLTTPGVLLGPNGLIAISGAATLPVGGMILALAALPQFTRPDAIPCVLTVEGITAAAILALSLVGAVAPELVPQVPGPVRRRRWRCSRPDS